MSKALWCSFLLFCSGCFLKKDIVSKKDRIFAHKMLLAKFSNIPDLPLHAVLDQVDYDIHNPDQIQVRYFIDNAIDDVVDYYMKNMERLGWNCLGKMKLEACCLQFSKPDLLCTVIIEAKKVLVFVVKRKDP